MPHVGGKEQELKYGGKLKKKTKVGNYGGDFGNSGSEDGVGKKIGDVVAENENQKFSKSKPNMWPKHKPNPATYRKKSISWMGKYMNG